MFYSSNVCDKDDERSDLTAHKYFLLIVSKAARSACNLMGARVFYDQLTVDMVLHQTHRFTDEIDVTTLKDYKKVSQFKGRKSYALSCGLVRTFASANFL
jgi:hypothetical protein